MAITNIDEQKLEAFIGHAATELGAALNAALVTLGDELGLYKAMADGQPVQPAELAARTGTQERYVREWLAAQAASGFLELGDDGYVLPPEHALVLADDTSPFAMIGAFQSAGAAIKARERVAERFVTGDGLGWHEHHHGLFHGFERAFAAGYRTYLVAEWLPALDGVVERLEAGGSAADVGCGHGASTILMAQAFPAARFVGIDYHAESIAVARERAAEAGVSDRVTFAVAGADEIPGSGSRRPVALPRCSPRTAAACSSSRSRTTGPRTTSPRSGASTTRSRHCCGRRARSPAPTARRSGPRRARRACARCSRPAASARSAGRPRRR